MKTLKHTQFGSKMLIGGCYWCFQNTNIAFEHDNYLLNTDCFWIYLVPSFIERIYSPCPGARLRMPATPCIFHLLYIPSNNQPDNWPSRGLMVWGFKYQIKLKEWLYYTFTWEELNILGEGSDMSKYWFYIDYRKCLKVKKKTHSSSAST